MAVPLGTLTGLRAQILPAHDNPFALAAQHQDLVTLAHGPHRRFTLTIKRLEIHRDPLGHLLGLTGLVGSGFEEVPYFGSFSGTPVVRSTRLAQLTGP